MFFRFNWSCVVSQVPSQHIERSCEMVALPCLVKERAVVLCTVPMTRASVALMVSVDRSLSFPARQSMISPSMFGTDQRLTHFICSGKHCCPAGMSCVDGGCSHGLVLSFGDVHATPRGVGHSDSLNPDGLPADLKPECLCAKNPCQALSCPPCPCGPNPQLIVPEFKDGPPTPETLQPRPRQTLPWVTPELKPQPCPNKAGCPPETEQGEVVVMPEGKVAGILKSTRKRKSKQVNASK